MLTKRNGSVEDFDSSKLRTAIQKASDRCGESIENITDADLSCLSYAGHVDDVHTGVVQLLKEKGLLKVKDSYATYVDYKTSHVSVMQELHDTAKNLMTHGDRENANAESTLISTQQSLLRGSLTKELYKRNYLSQEELSAIEDGYLYIHDLKDLLFGGFNCGLFDIGEVLSGGFEMANLKYSEPTNILSALQLIGDITLAASAQQYGGFSLPEIDKVLVPYYMKSVETYSSEANLYQVDDVDKYVQDKVSKDLKQGFQSLEMKLNSIPSSRGDFAFTTLSFGNLDGESKKEQQEICKAILRQRMSQNPVVFPKLVMLFSWEQNQNCKLQQELFDLCIKCSSENLYPDYLAIDTQGQVSALYKETGKVVTPMGK